LNLVICYILLVNSLQNEQQHHSWQQVNRGFTWLAYGGRDPNFFVSKLQHCRCCRKCKATQEVKEEAFLTCDSLSFNEFFPKLLFCFIEKTLWNCDWISYFQFIEQNEVLTMNYQVIEEEAFNPWVRQLTITKKMAADTHLFVLVTRLVTMLVTTFVQCSFADNQSGSGYGVLKFSSIKNILSS